MISNHRQFTTNTEGKVPKSLTPLISAGSFVWFRFQPFCLFAWRPGWAPGSPVTQSRPHGAPAKGLRLPLSLQFPPSHPSAGQCWSWTWAHSRPAVSHQTPASAAPRPVPLARLRALRAQWDLDHLLYTVVVFNKTPELHPHGVWPQGRRETSFPKSKTRNQHGAPRNHTGAAG